MELEDLEIMAIEYEGSQRSKELNRPLAEVPPVDRETFTTERQARLGAVLEKVEAFEILSIVKSDVWKEGHIMQRHATHPNYTRTVVNGYELISDPIEMVKSERVTNNSALVQLEQTNLRLSLEANAGADGRDSIMLIPDPQGFSMHLLPENLKGKVADVGLVSGLVEGLRVMDLWVPNIQRVFMDEDDPQGHLASQLISWVKMVKEAGSLPEQIRQWSTDRLAELPPELKDRKSLGSEDLREWAYPLLGTPKFMRALDRLIHESPMLPFSK